MRLVVGGGWGLEVVVGAEPERELLGAGAGVPYRDSDHKHFRLTYLWTRRTILIEILSLLLILSSGLFFP